MQRAIEPNPDLAPATLPGAVMSELCGHALEAVPEECCGLVTGTAINRFRTVYRMNNVMTRMHLSDPEKFPRDAHHAFYMSEPEILKARDDAERRGEQVTAIYHSHVDSGVYLSSDDLAYAAHPLFPFPDAAQIVLSMLGDRVKGAALFERVSGNPGFRGRLIEVKDA